MSLPHAILGILNYMPMTGYDLNSFFGKSINFFWSAQMSQIYRELKGLENKGFVVASDEASSKGPHKRIYRITKKGTEHLKEWLKDIPEKIDEDNRNAFLLRVMLLSTLGADELYSQIELRLAKYREDIEKIQAVESELHTLLNQIGKEDLLPYWKITISRGYHDVKSHIEWAEESLRELKKITGKKK
ncbi:MAG TPA: PadR family transcriptional regulator [Spirochaetota bacterium]|nr:PadR family transcriptional regulator [Spirochaetota bacterium]